MVKRKEEYISDIKENMRGGDGQVEIMDLIPADYVNKKCRLFAKLTIKEGSSIGFHTHSGEAETYYILSGTGTAFDDNGNTVTLNNGDGMYTGFGAGHSIKNTGKEDLVFIALILLD